MNLMDHLMFFGREKNMKKMRILFSCFSLLAAAVILTGCASRAEGEAATPTPYPTPVRTTYAVQRGDIIVNATLSGQAEPRAVSSVYFQMSGTVGKVYVQPNEQVMKGQLLAELQELTALEAKAGETRRAIQRAEINVQIAQDLLEKYKAQGASPYDIHIQELQVQLAQLDLEEVLSQNGLTDAGDAMQAVDAQLSKAKVFAPSDGVIISTVTPGRAITSTTEAFVIGDPNQMEVVATPDLASRDSLFQQMFEGMPVSVIMDAKPDVQLTGSIFKLPSPYGTGDSNDTFVRFVIDQAPSVKTYQAGDKMTVHIELANKTGVLWLPPNAIHQAGGRTFVVVDSDTGPKRIDITIGLQTKDKVEILSGLEEGQIVIGQ